MTEIEILGTFRPEQKEMLFTLMRWISIPSAREPIKIEGLYSKLDNQAMMFGVYNHSPMQKQVQYVTKPIGQRVTLIFGPETVTREVHETFELMVRLGLVAAVLLKPEETPPQLRALPTVLHQ